MKHLPKVFVVDDDLAVLKSVEAILTPHGYDVRYFRSAEEFMAQPPSDPGWLRPGRPMILGMGGSELLQCLQETGSLLSVVIFSGLIEPAELDDPESVSASVQERPYEVADSVNNGRGRGGRQHSPTGRTKPSETSLVNFPE